MRILNKRCTQKGMLMILGFVLAVIYMLVNPTHVRADSAQEGRALSDISQIDESKYPGYKDKLLELQNRYPNWNIKVLYTGLDWNHVIEGEYAGHGKSPSNLIPDSYNGEWLCDICGSRRYDNGSWVCASKKAIAYYMDPRNYLNSQNLFQFQNLTSTSDVSKFEIEKMTYGTFLAGTEQAIIDAAKANQISPYHLVTRMIQEHGRDGGVLVAGNGYKGQYIGYYNFFNIGASGNTEEEVILNGLKTACENGWDTKAKSIMGGSTTIGNNYLKKGQNTVYFEKFNVVNPPYYQHQYQQNLMVAVNEGNSIRRQYESIFSIDQGNFEFVIPLYENMPQTLSQKPLKDGEAYEGNLNTSIKNINFTSVTNQSGYISGNVIVVEWINGVSNVPRQVPVFRIKSTDGTVSETMFAKQIAGNEYYFDKYLDNLDPTKQYVIEVEASNPENVSNNKKTTIVLPDKYLGINQNLTLEIKNGKIQYQYQGNVNTEMQTFELKENTAKVPYITGQIVIVEWVNGISKVPATTPAIYLVATDGSTKEAAYVESKGGNTYYFDKYIEGLNTAKQYYLQIELTEPNNISSQKTQITMLKDKTLGTFKNKQMIVKENKIQFPYSADIQIKTKDIGIVDKHILKGTVEAVELVDGKTESLLEVNPKVTMKSTDASLEYTLTVSKKNDREYSFEIDLNHVDVGKEYELEIETINPNNSSSKTKATMNYVDTTIGKYQYLDTKIQEGKLIWNYVGNISSELKRFDMKQAANGAHYISGEIVVIEWIDGTSTVPEVLPKITLKSTDGKVSYESFITPTGTNTYYFDQYIEDIDHSKEYIYELESGNPKNISEKKKQEMKIPDQELGLVKEWKAKIDNNKLVFAPDTYIGNINSELKRFDMKQAANGASYINGEIVIVEWVDGVSTVPEVLPKITLKSTDGTVSYESFITPTGTNTYYFDQYIEDINHSKEYIYELESGNPKNVSENKKMQITIPNQDLGMVKEWKTKIEDNKLIFAPDTYIGNINSELKRFDMKQAANGASYISGEIVIVEWVDGVSTVPEVLPKITLKSTDGMVSYESFITPTGTNTYYFDQYIEDIDYSKEYIYELESGNPKNVSENKKMQITIPNQDLGMVKEWEAKIENNILKFEVMPKIENVSEDKEQIQTLPEVNGVQNETSIEVENQEKIENSNDSKNNIIEEDKKEEHENETEENKKEKIENIENSGKDTQNRIEEVKKNEK